MSSQPLSHLMLILNTNWANQSKRWNKSSREVKKLWLNARRLLTLKQWSPSRINQITAISLLNSFVASSTMLPVCKRSYRDSTSKSCHSLTPYGLRVWTQNLLLSAILSPFQWAVTKSSSYTLMLTKVVACTRPGFSHSKTKRLTRPTLSLSLVLHHITKLSYVSQNNH